MPVKKNEDLIGKVIDHENINDTFNQDFNYDPINMDTEEDYTETMKCVY